MDEVEPSGDQARPPIRRALISLAFLGAFAAVIVGIVGWLALSPPVVKPAQDVAAPSEAPAR